MNTSRINEIPLGLGEASCDEKLRIRLKSGWPSYFLRERRTDCGLFVTTLDHETITVFDRQEYLDLRAYLVRIKDPDKLLERYAEWGGEAALDGHGRFVLPARVRKFLSYDPAGLTFTIPSALPATLEREEYHEKRVSTLTYGPEIRQLSDHAFLDSGALEGGR